MVRAKALAEALAGALAEALAEALQRRAAAAAAKAACGGCGRRAAQRRAHGQHTHRREEVQSGTTSSTRCGRAEGARRCGERLPQAAAGRRPPQAATRRRRPFMYFSVYEREWGHPSSLVVLHNASASASASASAKVETWWAKVRRQRFRAHHLLVAHGVRQCRVHRSTFFSTYLPI